MDIPETYKTNAKKQNFADVELTPEEIEEAMYQARKKKYHLQKEREYWDKVNAEMKRPVMDVNRTREFYLKRAEKLPYKFVIDDENRGIFDLLCLYFAGDPAFNHMQPGFNLNKGLMLAGGIGCGKTEMIKLFSLNQRESYTVVQSGMVVSDYNQFGSEIFETYQQPTRIAENYFGQCEIGVCFDDLGTEPDGNHFKDKQNVMQRVIYDRSFARLCGITHCTHNMTVDQINERYGERVRSRMREMFNFITYPIASQDRRK